MQRIRSGARGGLGRLLALGAGVLLIVLAYFVTPYSAHGPEGNPSDAWVNSRYVVPAIIAAAPATAWAVSAAGRARTALEALLGVATLDALRRSTELPLGDVSAPATAAGLVAVAGVALVWLRTSRIGVSMSRPALAAALAAVLVAAVVVGALHEDRYSANWYRGFNPVIDYVKAQAARDARIGIVGDGFSNYPLFGYALENDVEFVGRRVDEMLRPLDAPARFKATLRRRDYDLVYVQRLDTLDPGLPRRQERWLRDAGYRELAAAVHPVLGTEIVLYEPAG